MGRPSPACDRFSAGIRAVWLWPVACLMAFSTGAAEAVDRIPSVEILTVDEMRRQVEAASVASPPWSGPRQGPTAAAGRTIVIISEDLRNGGILGVAKGVQEAAQVLDWKVRVFDAGGTSEGRRRAAKEALDADPDGAILDGADAGAMQPWLAPFAERDIPVVGWHVGPVAGATTYGPVAMNVSTNPLDVARITSMAAIVAAGGKAGVVIFTDSNFEIATTKAKAMAELVRACTGCTLLETRDIPISGGAKAVSDATRELLARYGERWTHGLAINDIYFDYAVPELILAGPAAQQISLLSAGDGSSAAFMRIQTGTFQAGTAAEPLRLHGWQLVDELNRLLEGEPVSGHVVPVHWVDAENVRDDGGVRLRYDPDNDYRDVYRRIWGR